jgi:hypothetical protein
MLDVEYASIQEIHRAFREKQLTVKKLVLTYLARIAKIDKCAEGLNSVLEIKNILYEVLFYSDNFHLEVITSSEEILVFWFVNAVEGTVLVT